MPRIGDWSYTAVQVFQRLKYRGAVGMLTFALLIICLVMAIVAYRAVDPTIVAIVLGVVALGFFTAVVLAIKFLGPLAMLDSTQVAAVVKMKNSPPMPPKGPPVVGSGGTSLLDAPKDSEEQVS